MELTSFEHLVYGMLAGLTEIFPVSANAHSVLMLKVLGAERIATLPVLLIRIGILAAIYISCRVQLLKMARARKMARIPKKKRKRPLDMQSLLDSRFLGTMILPMLLMLFAFRTLSGIKFSLLAVSGLTFLNGIILYIPQFLPGSNKDARMLSRLEGFLMGLGGCLSVIPGLSGIGAAVSIGSVCGVEPVYALNMSLLLNMVYLLGRVFYDIVDLISVGFGFLTIQLFGLYLLSAVIAFVIAVIAIRIMRSLAASAGYHYFAFYCWGIALFAFILNLMA